jgi:hypothetical protein
MVFAGTEFSETFIEQTTLWIYTLSTYSIVNWSLWAFHLWSLFGTVLLLLNVRYGWTLKLGSICPKVLEYLSNWTLLNTVTLPIPVAVGATTKGRHVVPGSRITIVSLPYRNAWSILFLSELEGQNKKVSRCTTIVHVIKIFNMFI